jgi:DNA-binding NarL/FixJ family response regulator
VQDLDAPADTSLVTNVLVCDDAPAARDAVRRVVSSLPAVTKVTTAASGEEVLLRFPTERPDVVLLDLRMPGIGGLETTRRLCATHPEAVVIVLTTGQDPDFVGQAVALGARGYLMKDASREELAAAVAISRGNGNGRQTSPVNHEGRTATLTEREQQVLEGMSRGLSNGEIGQELFLSEDTVKTHARRLFRKMGTHDRAHAVAQGFRWGLLN